MLRTGKIIVLVLSLLLLPFLQSHSLNVKGTYQPTTTTVTLSGLDGDVNPDEQVISTDPLSPSTMTIHGLFQQTFPGGGMKEGYRTTNYWGTAAWGQLPLINNAAPGSADNAGAFSGNGSYYAGSFLQAGDSRAAGLQIIKTSDGINYAYTGSRVFQNNVTFTTPLGATVYPCAGFRDEPSIGGDQAANAAFSTSIYVVIENTFATTPNSSSCNAGSGVAFEASSDGGNSWPYRLAFSGSYLSAFGHHPIATSTNGTLFLAGTDNGQTCASPGGIVVYRSTNGGSSFTPSCVFAQTNQLTTGPSSLAVYGTSVLYNSFILTYANVTGFPLHLFVSKSIDSGRTWSAPLRIDGIGDNHGVSQNIAGVSQSSGRVDIAWLDLRNSPNANQTQADLYYSYSSDGGNTYASPVRLTPNGPYNYCSYFTASHNGCQPGNDFFGMAETTSSNGTIAYISWSRGQDAVGCICLGEYHLYLTELLYPGDFSIASNPVSLNIQRGASGSATISVQSIAGSIGTVILASTLPSGITAGFSPSVVSLNGTSQLTLTVASSASIGNYTATVTGTSGSITHSVQVTVAVSNFSPSISPNTVAIPIGGSGSTAITETSQNGYSGTVSLSITSGVPSCVSYSFTPSSVQLPAHGTASSSLSFSAATTCTTSSTVPQVQSSSGSQTWTSGMTLNVTDFTVSATPTSLSIVHGNQKTSTITLTSLNGFSGTITLSAAVSPSVNHGPTTRFSATSVMISAGTPGTSTLTVSTANNTPKLTYTITVTATCGSITHSATVSVTVT